MTELNEATEDETPQNWKENSWDIKNNRPAPNDERDAMIIKSKQEGLTKRMNKFMIGEQAEEEKKLLPAAQRTDHFWAKTNASKGVNAKPGSVHIKPKTGNIIEVAESSHDTKTNLETKSEAKDDGSPFNAAKDDQSDTAQPKTSSMAKLSSELSKAHITPQSLVPPRFRSKQDDGKGFRRGRDRRRGKSKPLSPPAEPKEVPMKNAVMMLNEMFPPPGAAQYKVLSMKGSPNNPTFSMVCTIEGQEFEGTGRSKKEAKLAASQLALSTLFGKVTPKIRQRQTCDLFFKGFFRRDPIHELWLPKATSFVGHLVGTGGEEPSLGELRTHL